MGMISSDITPSPSAKFGEDFWAALEAASVPHNDFVHNQVGQYAKIAGYGDNGSYIEIRRLLKLLAKKGGLNARSENGTYTLFLSPAVTLNVSKEGWAFSIKKPVLEGSPVVGEMTLRVHNDQYADAPVMTVKIFIDELVIHLRDAMDDYIPLGKAVDVPCWILDEG